MNTDNIDKKILEELDNYFSYFKDESSWLKLKKYILKSIKPELRALFSKRHHNTKKHSINDYEKNIIDYCKFKFNIDLVLNEEEKHSNIKKPIWER